MKQIGLETMATYQAGESHWLAFGCAYGVITLKASFAFPVLFAFTAPLTVAACTVAALDAANKKSH